MSRTILSQGKNKLLALLRDLGYHGMLKTNKKENMKTIKYNNKTIKLPYTLSAGETSTEMVTRQNPFSGQSIELPEFAAVVYDKTIELNLAAERKDAATDQPPGISEHQKDWQKVREGINFFRQYFAREYMVLLD